MRRALAALAVSFVLAGSSGCLVLSLNPVYDDTTIAWDPDLVGTWHSVDDKASIRIERGEWRSYKLHYEHQIEAGDLTAYLTIVDNERYLDVMPARGQDRGSFLVPVHALLRLRRDGDRLELTPLSYDWFGDRVRGAGAVAGLSLSMDQKENVLIVSATEKIRAWLRGQAVDGPMFGAPATFARKSE